MVASEKQQLAEEVSDYDDKMEASVAKTGKTASKKSLPTPGDAKSSKSNSYSSIQQDQSNSVKSGKAKNEAPPVNGSIASGSQRSATFNGKLKKSSSIKDQQEDKLSRYKNSSKNQKFKQSSSPEPRKLTDTRIK